MAKEIYMRAIISKNGSVSVDFWATKARATSGAKAVIRKAEKDPGYFGANPPVSYLVSTIKADEEE